MENKKYATQNESERNENPTNNDQSTTNCIGFYNHSSESKKMTSKDELGMYYNSHVDETLQARNR